MENINLGNNQEIENALKEFEAKNVQQSVPAPVQTDNSENSKMVDFVIKNSGGLIKEKRQAEYLLLFFAILILIISLYIFFGGNKSISEEDIKKMIESHPELAK